MSTERLLADNLVPSRSGAPKSHPSDSSRLLLGLMLLSWRAEHSNADETNTESLGGIISTDVLRSLLSALHYRDVGTINHARRVARLSVGMGQYLGWEGSQLNVLEVASLLHDIGKIGVPDNILFKPGKLSDDEVELMALHHNIGVDVLQACRVDKEVLEIVVQAHSHYNGANDGYRLIGGDVHQGARILAVADAYDSLATDQVYREGKRHEEILQILHDAAGTQFDGNVLAALARWIERDGLPFSNSNPQDANPHVPPGPSQPEEALEASSLCHIFSYLYVLESLYDGFYLVDSDLRYVIWNRGSEKLLGHPAQKMRGQLWSSRVLCHQNKYGEPMPEQDYPMNQVIATGKPTMSTLQMKSVDGNWIQVELQSVPLVDQNGQLQGVAEIFRDLSRTSNRPQEYRDLKLAASRDSLTSVANRGELETQLAVMVTEFSQHPGSEPLSVIFLDIDFFKTVNDTFGYSAGDDVLIDISRLLQHETYSGELIGRYGGEEFVILCPETELDDAVRRAERLRLAIESSDVGGISGHQVTASFGVTQVETGDSVESILRRADKALYQAKDSGRNRTCSLTSSQGSDSQSLGDDCEDDRSDPFVYSATFHACDAADMVVFKLRGFVDGNSARVIDVSPERVVIQLGKRGLLPFWGRSDDKRPVELIVEFGAERRLSQRATSKQVEITALVRPLGRVRSQQAFEERARRVIKTLRSFFLAD